MDACLENAGCLCLYPCHFRLFSDFDVNKQKTKGCLLFTLTFYPPRLMKCCSVLGKGQLYQKNIDLIISAITLNPLLISLSSEHSYFRSMLDWDHIQGPVNKTARSILHHSLGRKSKCFWRTKQPGEGKKRKSLWE